MDEIKDVFLNYVAKSIPFILLIFAPIYSAMVVVCVLVLLDLVLGVWASWKEGYHITSRSMRRTIPKLLVYEITIAVMFLMETYLFEFPITKIITALIGVIEGKSLFENLYRITKVDFLHIVITKLQLVGDRLNPSSKKDTQDVYTGKKDEKKKRQD